MKISIFRIVYFLAIFQISFEFSCPQHSIILSITLTHLNPKVKKIVTAILSSLKSTNHKYHIVEETACWADDIKKTEDRVHKGEDHYINIPFYDGIHPSEAKISHKSTDAVTFLKETRQKLIHSARRNKHPTEEDAINLRKYIHIWGDLHQPLHTISRYHQKDLNGDNGGNQFLIEGGFSIGNLHSLWDQTMGEITHKKRPYTRRSFKQYEAIASEIQQEFSKISGKYSQIDPIIIANENHQIAIESAYKGISEGEIPSNLYKYTNWRECKRLIATAAYRLSNDLNEIYSQSSYQIDDTKTTDMHNDIDDDL